MAIRDQYNCTFHEADPISIIQAFEAAEPFALIEPDPAKHGYQVGQKISRGGEAIARVWWQGNPGVHVIVHNENAEKYHPMLRGLGAHSVRRMDVKEDFIEQGGFDKQVRVLVPYAQARGLKLNYLGDWARGKSRTLYIGSRKSNVMMRIYEKGWQVGGDPNWWRLEVEIKPKDASKGMEVSGWTIAQALGASKWLVEAFTLLGWDHLQAQSIGTVYRPSDDERARLTLMKQYGGVIRRWMDEAGDSFPMELLKMLEELAG